MKKYSLVLIFAAVLASCGTRTPENASPDAKLQYKPEENKVEIAELKRSDFPVQILSNGKLFAARKASLAFRSTGTISSVRYKPGDRVPKGAVIATLNRPDTDLALESAEISLERARLELYDRLAGLGYPASDTSAVPAEVLAMAKMRSGYSAAKNEVAKARYEKEGVQLKAPFSGIIADVTASAWDQAPSGAFCTLIDNSSMNVKFSIMESDIAKVAAGLPIRVTPFASDGQEYKGRITAVNPSVGKNGLIEITGSLPGSAGLMDGMNVKVIVSRSVPGALVVPKSAVVVRDNLNVLFTYSDDGTAHWVYVNILDSNAESYRVEANEDRGAELHEGDMVIVSGNLNLADGSKVTLQ